MKRIVATVEGPSGLESLLGEQVVLLCSNYFYAGKLTGINAQSVELTDASMVYETGEWSSKSYKDAQRLPGKVWNVNLVAIESYGLSK